VSSFYDAGGDTSAATGPYADGNERFARVPEQMKASTRWLLWKREFGEDGKVKKVPHRIDGARANPADETTWMRFDDAVKTMPLISADGIGFAFTDKDDFCGIDLDNACDPATGRLTFVAHCLIKTFGSYTEWSPSGIGIHIFFKGRKPAGSRCKALVNAETKESVEFYDNKRFFTVTGEHVAGTPSDVREVPADLIAGLVAYMEACAAGESSTSYSQQAQDDGSPELDDDEVRRIMFDLANGAKLRCLHYDEPRNITVGDRSDSAGDWALAITLAEITGRKRTQIERIMRDSPRYQRRPKWDERRDGVTYLTYTINRACNATVVIYGVGLNGSANGRASHSNGAAANSGDAGTNGATHNARPGRTAEFMSVGQLLSEPEDEQSYVVEGMLGGGSTALVSAKPKVGKTTLLLFLALCVVRGLHFFGRRVKRGAVLYVALEGNKREWKRVAKAMGFVADDLFFIYVGQAPQDAIAWLRENAAKYNPALIIVDTFQRFARLKNISDYAEVTNATEPLVEIARESDAVLLCAIHAKKQNKDGDDGDAVLGSTGLFGAVDTLISLKKTMNGSRVMSTEQRYGDNMPETVLALDPETKRLSLSGERADVDRIVIEQRILTVLAESPDLTEPVLLAEAGGRTETVIHHQNFGER
jgi:putative DNA primase/helicase